MPRLNQVIALTPGKKAAAQKKLTEVHHLLAKGDKLFGITRDYKPLDENGEQQPAERKYVEVKCREAVRAAAPELAEMFDAVATVDIGNTHAKADVVVDGVKVLEAVPVTHLLFLEKQLTDLQTFAEKLPVLDPAERWTFDPNTDTYVSEASQTNRTKKIPKNHEKAPATDRHPAQVEIFTEDVLVGVWTVKKFSGAVPAKERNELLARVRKLAEAVKVAREEANNVEVVKQKVGAKVLKFVFGDYLA